MNIENTRDKIRRNIEEGYEPKILSDYRRIRDTEEQRHGRVVEELLEYILWLERKEK
ncbi:hypothetical protein M316_0026 [Nitrincola phage 1M3-16]|uniref:hypothetical protein n=1 Tax=Nitrincola phage 1M3-16 TaxID=1472912 RepID=UPI000444BB5D|nr:hypothetical protein GJ22_gp126 [Nitrincola phage 1M3-16]AHX01091.1 hypothetical protein M316_0026 [Nitrincola phage 1M3-16]